MAYDFRQFDFNGPRLINQKKKFLFLVGLIIFIYIFFTLGKTFNIITTKQPADGQLWWQKFGLFLSSSLPLSSSWEEKEMLNKNFPWPAEEEDRWDVLILGIRGADDPDGGLLSDSIMFFSLDKKTGKSGLISIPRDLYVNLPGLAKGKINEIYEKGVARRKAVDFSKEVFSRLTGVYVDNTVAFNFNAFKEIIDDLDGIDINLAKPFEENKQWGYKFFLPAGPNHLNGQDALYFVRSRFSTSDFDRSWRQQQIALAVKDKIFSANLLNNPIKLVSILKNINKNIVTDLNIFDTDNLVKMADSFSPKQGRENQRQISLSDETGPGPNQPALDNLSTKNLLHESFQDNIYILKPKNNDWKLFRDYFKTVLN